MTISNALLMRLLAPGAGLLLMLNPLMSHATFNYSYSSCCNSCGGGSTNDGGIESTCGLLEETTAYSAKSHNGYIKAADLVDYGSAGFGVINDYEGSYTGPHAIDNVYGNSSYDGTDFVLMQFSEEVTLTSFTIGWDGDDNGSSPYTDSDVSVLAYTGPATSSMNLAGSYLGNLVGGGWQLIGNYANVGDNNNLSNGRDMQSVSTPITSSWWLISAYSQVYSGSSTPVSSNGGYLGGGNDAFKILAVACEKVTTPPPNQTPEPGALALAGLGLVGMMAVRRRRNPA
ncbi:MAG: exosortase-dependent surface protein XDP1 [Pseudomonadota bacterium]